MNNYERELNTLIVVIVLYFPEKSILRNTIKLLVKSKVKVVFVDNTPGIVNKELLAISRKETSSIGYIPLKKNIGIASAQNIGINYAQKFSNINFLMFLDQDSEISYLFVRKMLEEYQRIEKSGVKISALGPIIIDKETKKEYKRIPQSNNSIQRGFSTPSILINSGMLIAMDTFKIVGVMDNTLFIDAVDFEWCWRAKTKGYQCCMTQNVELNHKVGNSSKFIFNYRILVSAPIRYYYQYRNYILLLKRPYVPLTWKVKNLIKKMFFLIYLPFSCKDGILILTNMLKGINSGLFHKTNG